MNPCHLNFAATMKWMHAPVACLNCGMITKHAWNFVSHFWVGESLREEILFDSKYSQALGEGQICHPNQGISNFSGLVCILASLNHLLAFNDNSCPDSSLNFLTFFLNAPSWMSHHLRKEWKKLREEWGCTCNTSVQIIKCIELPRLSTGKYLNKSNDIIS